MGVSGKRGGGNGIYVRGSLGVWPVCANDVVVPSLTGC